MSVLYAHVDTHQRIIRSFDYMYIRVHVHEIASALSVQDHNRRWVTYAPWRSRRRWCGRSCACCRSSRTRWQPSCSTAAISSWCSGRSERRAPSRWRWAAPCKHRTTHTIIRLGIFCMETVSTSDAYALNVVTLVSVSYSYLFTVSWGWGVPARRARVHCIMFTQLAPQVSTILSHRSHRKPQNVVFAKNPPEL